MGLFDKNKVDPNKVALQNIVLNINEKKLEVSEEFLDEMTKIYISKRMKLINDAVQSFPTLKKVALLFAKYKYIDMLLDELEKIEPYHTFNPPKPSEYRKQLFETRSDYINNIITRGWKQLGYNSEIPASEIEVSSFFGEYRDVYEELPEDSQNLINGLHEGVYNYGILDDPPEEEPEEDEDAEDEDTDEEDDDGEEEDEE